MGDHTMNDYPTDIELGLEPDREAYATIIERCGCEVSHDALHDVDDCLEFQADEYVYREDLRLGGMWEVR